jgi:hypothetical protein
MRVRAATMKDDRQMRNDAKPILINTFFCTHFKFLDKNPVAKKALTKLMTIAKVVQ